MCAPAELTILMPCLNEAETLATCIRKASDFLARHSIVGEVVVADNGSTDGSQEIARSCGARVLDVPRRGYGAALYQGSLAARGVYVIMGDSDDSYDFADLMAFVDKLRARLRLRDGQSLPGRYQARRHAVEESLDRQPAPLEIGRFFFIARWAIFNVDCGATPLRHSRGWTCRRREWSLPPKW